MSQITVSLPDAELERFVYKVVQNDALASPSEYLLRLIRADRRRRAQEKIEQLLIEGLDSELIEANDEYWERKDREFDSRYPSEAEK